MRILTVSTALVVSLLAAWTLPATRAGNDEPDKVVVQHILIGYKGKVPGKTIDRTKAEARALASEILERAAAGEDFETLVKENTDDSFPGIYTMTNRGVPHGRGEFSRERMASRFGDVAFSLAVGEVGLARYHPDSSPYGWHVIKRIE